MRNVFRWSILLSFALLFGCEDDTQTPVTPDEQLRPLEAKAMANLLTPAVGEEVSLDASQSKDPDNVGYQISWVFHSKPDNSASVISGDNQATANFTPDQTGEYVIILKISNAEKSLSATDTITITASAPAYVVIDSDINADRVLENINADPDKKDYLVTRWIAVNAKLSIMPDVRIHFAENAGFAVVQQGVLVANGEEAQPIILSGDQQVKGYWRGIFIGTSSAQNSMSHAEISYAGSQDADTYFRKAALTIDEGAISLNRVSITHSALYGIQTRRSGSSFPMSNMNFAENEGSHFYIHPNQLQHLDDNSTFDKGYVEVYGGDTEDDHSIPALNGARYLVSAEMALNSKINIAPGAEFEFGPDASFTVGPQGVIIAKGQEDKKIIFTGKTQTAGAWKGIRMYSASVENVMEHVEISYAGSQDADTYFQKAALTIDHGKINLQNMYIAHSNGYGIQTRRNGSSFPMKNITFEHNSSSHLYLHPSQIQYLDAESNFNGGYAEFYKGDTEREGAETWPKLHNGKYLFSGDINLDRRVTIAPGAVFESATDVIISVRGKYQNVQGEIRAIGTEKNPIVFTGKSKAKGAWGGIIIHSGSTENQMEHIEISYGGGTDLDIYMTTANLGVYNEGKLSLKNASIANSSGFGIRVRESRKAALAYADIQYAENSLGDLKIE